LFDTEAGRKIKKEPELAIDQPKGFISFPTSVMTSAEGEGGSELDQLDIVGELWSFA